MVGAQLEEDLAMHLALEEDNEMFEEYAAGRLAQWRAMGRDTKPIELALAKMAKSGKSLAA